MRHLLSIADLTRDDVERILETAGALQGVDEKLPTLRGKLVLSLFFESSTRTSSSFELAAKRLSADVMSLKAAGSSVDKGESLKDTVLTLAQYEPHAIVVRHPQIGAPQLVARYSGAAVVNAGDGKHQHPTQALLDLFTMREALGELEGLHVAIVGDVLHSRVARSLIQALALVGAHTTLVGPPTLLPRGIEAMGCETSTEIGAIADADVVYVLRMQRERMESAFVPSLREYAARWGITPERVRPGPEGDAPRPDQPRRRDRRPRRRLARLADPRAGALRARGADGGAARPARRDGPRASGGGRMRRSSAATAARTASCSKGGSRGGECVAVTVDRRRHLARSSPQPRRRTCSHRRSSTRTSTCARPAARTRRRSRRGTAAAAAGGYCAILAMPNTDPVVDSAAVLGSLVETARREALVPTGFMAAISKRLGGEELTEMGELADAGAAAFTDDGRPVTSAGLMRRALQYGAVTGRKLALHCEEPTLSRDGQVHEGAVCAELGFAPYPSVAESAMVERDLSLAGYEARPLHLMHLSAKESVDALRARARARGRGDGGGDAASPRPHRRGGPLARPEREDEPAAPRRRGPPGADRGAPRRHDRLRRHRPRAALARGEGGAVRGGAVRRHRASRPRSPRSTPTSSSRARPARDAARADVRRARPARSACRSRRIEVGARANLVLLDLEAEWTVDGERLPLPLRQLVAARPARCAAPSLKTVADGRVVHG